MYDIRSVDFIKIPDIPERSDKPISLPGYVDYELLVLGDGQRVPLLVVLAIVVLFALVANVATIVVNVRRFVAGAACSVRADWYKTKDNLTT